MFVTFLIAFIGYVSSPSFQTIQILTTGDYNYIITTMHFDDKYQQPKCEHKTTEAKNLIPRVLVKRKAF